MDEKLRHICGFYVAVFSYPCADFTSVLADQCLLKAPLRLQFQIKKTALSLQWRHYERDGVLNSIVYSTVCSGTYQRKYRYQIHLTNFVILQSKTSKLCVTGLYEGNPPVTGGFPSRRAVSRKIFSFDDVIISILTQTELRTILLQILYITLDVTCAPWRLKAPLIQPFDQRLVHNNIKENINTPPYWTHRWPVYPHSGLVTWTIFLSWHLTFGSGR